MSATLAWRMNRLKAMQPAEVCWRLQQFLVASLERLGFGLAPEAGAGAGTPGATWVSPLPAELDATPYVEAAERVIAGRWNVLSLRDCRLGFPPRWNRDPRTGVEAPLDFGRGIDYRDERIVGDIKYLWEPNRHLELVTLAQAWRLTRELRFAEGARSLLASWLEQCPYARGPNWASSLESGVRLVNWACAWHLLDGDASPLFAGEEGQGFRRHWLAAVHRHCHFISHNLSRHSSANNHLFGELMGLFVASVTWPLWPESARWRETARSQLETQAIRQIGADGVHREQAFWYQHEMADMMLLCLAFGRANGTGFSIQFEKRLERMLEFLAAVMDVGGHVPAIGDADDGVIVRFSHEPGFSPYRSLLATGAVLFGRGDFKAKAGSFDEKSRWLLGDAAAERFDSLPPAMAAEPPELGFPGGGYYVVGRDFGTPREVKCIVDAGPLGYLSIAAHGHADALAFTLSVGGNEILVDPGTYAYHRRKRWRDYFRGTSAHNTLRVDETDQSVSAGNFMWLSHARAWCEHFRTGAERDLFEGAHDGYTRLNDPVLHRRRIEFDKRRMRLEVIDTLECAAVHFVELHWHLAENCLARISGHTVEIRCSHVRVRLDCPPELGAPRGVIGRDSPALGWVSRRLDEKTRSPTIVCTGHVAGGAPLATAMTIAIGE